MSSMPTHPWISHILKSLKVLAMLMGIVHFGSQHPVVALCSLFICILCGLVIYRLFFHPLAKFPGPKLAAASLWYEYYYDGIKGGQYTFQIQRMHRKYGPIVRISPNELHIDDPSFIDTLYAGAGKRRDKYPYSAWQFGLPRCVFGTVDHDHHRLRRSALNRYFSKASVTCLEPKIARRVQAMCRMIEAHADTGRPIVLSNAYSCLTCDIATEYSFGRSTNFISSDNPAFEKNFRYVMVAGSMAATHSKRFPWVRPLTKMIPLEMLRQLGDTFASAMEFQIDMIKQVKDTVDAFERGEKKGGTTVFHELLAGDLPPEEKDKDRLEQEAQLIIGAGTETVGWSLSVATFYLLSQPSTLATLLRELREAIPDPANPPPVAVLETLPYLIIVSEALRVSYGVISRSPRISPHEPLVFRPESAPNTEHVIPAGTPVGISSYLVHNNPDIFPDSAKFLPERWLDSTGKRHRHLDPYLMSFSRGSRQCLGINLAYAELFLGLAGVIGTLGDRLELYNTTPKEVVAKHDYFIPVPESEDGVKVVVRGS